MRPSRLLWAAVLAAALLSAAGALGWRLRPIRAEYYSDAGTIRQPVREAQPRDILWQPPTPLSDLVNTTHEDYEPRLSWDGLTLFFVRGQAGENADIFVSRRTPAGWTQAEPLAAINSERDELGPEPAPDGAALYFYSDRTGGAGGYDLWVAHLAEGRWSEPQNLGPSVNSPFNDYGPAVSPDHGSLYFASNRPAAGDLRQPPQDAWPATLREEPFHRTYDLYVAPLTSRGPGEAQPLAALNTSWNDGSPCVSPAGDFLYFSSDRAGGLGGFDLYRARLIRGEPGRAENLGAPVNTNANELDPGLTALGYGLYFSSNRPGRTDAQAREASQTATSPAGLERKLPDYNLYYSSSREVFRDDELLARPAIDWAALLRAVLPNLLWALLALLLLLVLWALIGDIRKKRLALLTRCLLASLLAHMLLMLLFNSWRVTTRVMEFLRQPGEIHVALLGPTQGSEFTTQIRGELTELALPDAPTLLERRIDSPPVEPPPLEPTPEMALASAAPRAAEPLAAGLSVPEASPTAADALATFARPHATPPSPRLELSIPVDIQRVADTESTVEYAAPAASTGIPRPLLSDASQSQAAAPPVAIEPAATDPGRRSDVSVALDAAGLAPARDAAPELSPASVADSMHVGSQSQPTLALRDLPIPAGAEGRAAVAEATPGVAAAPPRASRGGLPQVLVAADAQDAKLLDPGARSAAPPSVRFAAADALPADAQDAARASALPALPAHLPPAADAQPLNVALPEAGRSAGAPDDDASEPTFDAIARQLAARPRPRHAATRLDTSAGLPSTTIMPSGMVALEPSATDSHESRDDFASRDRSAAPPVSACPVPPDATPAALQSPLASLAPTLAFAPATLDLPLVPVEPAGAEPHEIRGRITHARSGAPLAGASVRLEVAQSEPLTVQTDDDGRYRLSVPEMPDFFALTASLDGFVPAAANVPSSEIKAGVVTRDFALEPLTQAVIRLENEPRVYHLGNDRWEGLINSQFQTHAQGTRLRVRFPVSADQLAPHFSRAALTLMAKGVQCGHLIRINGQTLEQRLRQSPEDGSFGAVRIEFDIELLTEGANVLEIIDRECAGDMDDFEFVNPQIRLLP